MKKLLCLVLALMLLCGCGGGNSPEQALHRFVNAINNNDFPALLQCIPPEAAEYFMERMPKGDSAEAADIVLLRDLLHMDSPIKISALSTLKLSENYALVAFRMQSKDADELTATMCCRINGKWCVDFDGDFGDNEALAAQGAAGYPTPEETVSALFRACDENNADLLISTVNPSARFDVGCRLMQAMIEGSADLADVIYRADGAKIKGKIDDVHYQGDLARVSCTLTSDRGDTEKTELVCMLIDGRWYIDFSGW